MGTSPPCPVFYDEVIPLKVSETINYFENVLRNSSIYISMKKASEKRSMSLPKLRCILAYLGDAVSEQDMTPMTQLNAVRIRGLLPKFLGYISGMTKATRLNLSDL